MKKIISFSLVVFIFLITLTGCKINEEPKMEDKVTEEIRYIENKLVEIVNNFATREYEQKEDKNSNTSNNEVKEKVADEDFNETETNENIDVTEINNVSSLDYDRILEDTKNIEEASNRIMVDLATENVNNNEITGLSDGINKMISAISGKNEMLYLAELNNVLSLLPNYESKISSDSDEIFERRLKYFTVSSYISFVLGDKELAKTQVGTLESEYLEKQKSVDYVEKHKYNLNKIYLLIQELKKGIETDSMNIVQEKYLMLIDEI